METIQITLPDGSTRPVPRGTTPAELARQISPRLAEEALVARVQYPDGPPAEPSPGNSNGDLVDLAQPLEKDARVAILTQKDPAALEVFRHSAAHLLAAAVLDLFPNVKLGVGPPIEYGFFYEFLRDQPFTPEDLGRIEAKMRELAAQNIPNERKLLPKA